MYVGCLQISTGIGVEARDSIADMNSLSDLFSNGSALLGNTFSRMRSMARRQQGWFCNMMLFLLLVLWIFVRVTLTDLFVVVATIMYIILVRVLLRSCNANSTTSAEHRKTRQVSAPFAGFGRIRVIVKVESERRKICHSKTQANNADDPACHEVGFCRMNRRRKYHPAENSETEAANMRKIVNARQQTERKTNK